VWWHLLRTVGDDELRHLTQRRQDPVRVEGNFVRSDFAVGLRDVIVDHFPNIGVILNRLGSSVLRPEDGGLSEDGTWYVFHFWSSGSSAIQQNASRKSSDFLCSWRSTATAVLDKYHTRSPLAIRQLFTNRTRTFGRRYLKTCSRSDLGVEENRTTRTNGRDRIRGAIRVPLEVLRFITPRSCG